MQKIAWHEDVVDALKEDNLAIFVGNGLSRLSGAPSWSDLLNTEEINRYLHAEKINRAELSHYECADIISKFHRAEWDRVLNNLQRWSDSAKPSYSHRVIGKILKPGSRQNKIRVITSNVDHLLSKAGVEQRLTAFCHGEPDKKDSWIFSQHKIIESFKEESVATVFDSIDASVLLYIGYSHSHEDFDIANACLKSRRGRHRRTVFSLNSASTSTFNYLSYRHKQNDILPIEYQLPNNPSLDARDAFLASALLQLAVQAQVTEDEEIAHDFLAIEKWSTSRRDISFAKEKNSSFVIGLTGTNRHLQIRGNPPDGGRRHSIKAEVKVEAGGPGYIVAEILRTVGRNAFLVSKVATDPEGRKLLSLIERNNCKPDGTGTIFTNYLDVAEAGDSPLGFRTWESFIIEPSDPGLHRVFIDKSVAAKTMQISREVAERVLEGLHTDTPKVCYFDKFYRETIRVIFQSLNVDPRMRIPKHVWTIYETGSEGDRYFSNPPESFRESSAYDLERFLSEPKQARCINVVTASFRFSRDYLAKKRGGIDDKSYKKMIHRHDSIEIRRNSETKLSEDDIIDNLIYDAAFLKTFCAAVAKGGRVFLRDHALRLIFVTLHRRGCIVISVPNRGDPVHQHVDGVRIEEAHHFTASAGDVFRGVLTGAMATAQENGLDAAKVMEKDFLLHLARLCNECAAHKVTKPTVEDSLDGIKERFDAWKAKHF